MLSDLDSGELDSDAVLILAGELDLLTEPLLTALLEGPFAALGLRVVDLSGVTFADSSGLAPLLRHRHRLEIRGGSPRLCWTINLLVDLTPGDRRGAEFEPLDGNDGRGLVLAYDAPAVRTPPGRVRARAGGGSLRCGWAQVSVEKRDRG